jgi:hypothetical protein
VIEAPLVKKRKLRKMVDPTVPVTEPATLVIEPSAKVIETAAPAVKVTNVAGFLVAWRKQAPPPSVPRMANIEAFLANEPVLAIPMNMVELSEEPL